MIKFKPKIHVSIDFIGIACTALIILKLCGVISLSWWLVMMPIYLPFSLYLISVIIISIFINNE